MACWRPIELKTETQKKTGLKGNIVPCGRCLGCLSKKRRDWSMRLSQELKIASSASFLTLTYDDENLPKTLKLLGKDKKGSLPFDNDFKVVDCLDKNHLQKYFKRVRKLTPKLKYYAVGEYGSVTKRPHYHAIVFNADPEVLADKWEEGITHQGTVTDESIKYVTKYLINEELVDNPIKPFAIMSKGLGKIYLKHATKFHKRNFTLRVDPKGDDKSLIPRYYSDKIFSKAEKELLSEGFRREKVCLSPETDAAELEIKKRRVKRRISKTKSKSKNL